MSEKCEFGRLLSTISSFSCCSSSYLYERGEFGDMVVKGRIMPSLSGEFSCVLSENRFWRTDWGALFANGADWGC